jgi:hypothetical protein
LTGLCKMDEQRNDERSNRRVGKQGFESFNDKPPQRVSKFVEWSCKVCGMVL